jgi:hypothetical protein
MRANLKISITASSAIIISFLLLVFFLVIFPDPTYVSEKRFYSSKFDSKDKIFIIGSSHTGNLNATLINEQIQGSGNYIVYNLSYDSDKPSKRLRTINEIINLKPQIIFYGVSYNEFQSITYDEVKTSPNPSYIQNILLKNIGFDFSNPQFVTLQFIRESQKYLGVYAKIDYLMQPYTPFFEYHARQFIIENNLDIENEFLKTKKEIIVNPPQVNQELTILKKMISEFQKHKIKVVVFTTPYHRAFLNSLSDNQKETFEAILNDLQNDSNVTIYRLDQKYADLSIWYDVSHVSYNENSMIYSEDLANLIVSKIEQ